MSEASFISFHSDDAQIQARRSCEDLVECPDAHTLTAGGRFGRAHRVLDGAEGKHVDLHAGDQESDPAVADTGEGCRDARERGPGFDGDGQVEVVGRDRPELVAEGVVPDVATPRSDHHHLTCVQVVDALQCFIEHSADRLDDAARDRTGFRHVLHAIPQRRHAHGSRR